MGSPLGFGLKLTGSVLGLMLLAGCGGEESKTQVPPPAAESVTATASPAPSPSVEGTAPAAPTPTNPPNSGPTAAPDDAPAVDLENQEDTARMVGMYKQLLTELPQDTRQKLMASQGHWEILRDGNCQVEVDLYGDQRGGRSQCFALLAQNRMGQLTAIGNQTLLSGISEGTGLGQVEVEGQTVDCDDPNAGTPVVNYCAGLVYARDDQTLNEVYQELTGKLSASSKATLTKAQLAWIKMRDLQCEVETAPAVGGTGFEGYRSQCLADVTRLRTAELQTLFYDMP